MLSKKRGQAWGFDLMIASLIFTAGIIVFYIYSINTTEEADSTINKLTYDGSILSNILLLEGSPKNWTTANVVSPGLLTNNKINQTKIDNFYNLTRDNYSAVKALLNTQYDFYIYFSKNITANGQVIPGMGKIPSSPKNLIKIERVAIYNDQPLTMNIEIWE
ncbi:MAG: hypothetical protein Q7S27_03645 [Nanoarchaeota archaeon]|nr:hypothetical protein [Nanoarchaeota archaeon]